MRVELSRDVVEQESSFRYLTAISWLFADNRHKWVISDLDAVRNSSWLAGLGDRDRRPLLDHAERAARDTKPPDVRVEPTGAGMNTQARCWELPADIAETVLRRPLHVIVENANCDGAFLRLLMLRNGKARLQRRLGYSTYEHLRQGWRNPLGDGEWLEVRHGGGSTTAVQIRLAVEAEPVATRRIFVFVDSDRDRRGAPLAPTSTAAGVEKMCAGLRRAYPALRLDSHVLDKREVENYFPREVLLRRNRDATTDIWDKFDEEQKDFNDLKEIYTQKLWKVLTDPQHDGLFHEAALRDRGGPELDKIVDRLIAALS